MKVQWTSVTPAVGIVTLGDDSVKWATQIEQLGGQAVEQLDPLAFAANASRLMRGNITGDCVFTAAKSLDTIDAAAQFFAGAFARQNQQGTLLLTFSAQTLTMLNATLKSVRAIKFEGVRWTIRYTFGITTLTNP